MKPLSIASLTLRALCCASIALTACTVAPPLQHGVQIRPYRDRIDIAGKLSVQYELNDKPQLMLGSFEWRQNGDHVDIRLLSPLGQTIAKIESDTASARLKRANLPDKIATDIDQLLADELGWPLPVTELRDWLQGFVRDRDGQRTMLPATDMQTDTASGWHLRYASWQEDEQQTFPKLIDLRRWHTHFGNIQVKVAIREWSQS